MQNRPATLDDVAATAELTRRAETAWFGAPEHDESEIKAYFEQVDSFETGSRLFFEDGRLVAVALHSATDNWFTTDPDPEVTRRVAAELIGWYGQFDDPRMETLDRDEALRAVLSEHDWRHERSSFELNRAATDDWQLAEPKWPDGVTLRDFTNDDAAAVYHLIYVDAAWASVPGHPHREYEPWRSLFITEHTTPDQQVLAWRGDRLVGAAIGRIFGDGMGWIAQLAVATDERGNGLGRALLLEGLRRRRAAGATAVGLSVQADNRNALDLYLSAGLQIDREWMEYRPA
jgi:ribosomal protein S18 acetylase RimI-like enzyme